MDTLANIPNTESTAQQWIAWHKALLSEGFKLTEVNATFSEAWKKRGSSNANNSELREYLAKKGYDLDADMWDKTVDFATDPFGIVSELQTFKTVGQSITVVIIVMSLAFVGIVLYQLAKNPKLIGQGAALMVTKGR